MNQLGWEIVGGICGLILFFAVWRFWSISKPFKVPWMLLAVVALTTWFFGFVFTIGPNTYPAMVCATGIFALEAIRNTRLKEKAEARVERLEEILRLIRDRHEEGSLVLDSAEDHSPEDPEPIQNQITRILAICPHINDQDGTKPCTEACNV